VAAQRPGEGIPGVTVIGGAKHADGGRVLIQPSATLSQRRAEKAAQHRPEVPAWKDWLLLAWATFFGALYALMIVRSRAPGLYETVRRLFSR
jgi:hypothetical protein